MTDIANLEMEKTENHNGRTIVDMIEDATTNFMSATFRNVPELGEAMSVAILKKDIPSEIEQRIWDPDGEQKDQTLVDFISSLWELSKGEVRRLMGNNGIKVNNTIAKPDMLLKDVPWKCLEDNMYEYCVIKKGKNTFDVMLIRRF